MSELFRKPVGQFVNDAVVIGFPKVFESLTSYPVRIALARKTEADLC